MRQLTETTKARDDASWRKIQENRMWARFPSSNKENIKQQREPTHTLTHTLEHTHTNQIQSYKHIEKEPQDKDNRQT